MTSDCVDSFRNDGKTGQTDAFPTCVTHGPLKVVLMIRRKRADSIRARGTMSSPTGRIYGRNPDLLLANNNEIILQTGVGPYMNDRELPKGNRR